MSIKNKPILSQNKGIVISTESGISEARLLALLRIIRVINIGVILVQIANLFGIYLVSIFNPAAQTNQGVSTSTILVLAISVICAAGMGFAEIWFSGLSARKEEQLLRQKLMRKAFEAQLPVKKEIGAMVNLYTDSIERFCEYRQIYLGPTKAALTLPFLVLIYLMIFVDWLSALVLILMCPLIPLAIIGFMRLFSARSKRSRKQRANLSAKYLEALQTLSTLRLFGAAAAKEQELKAEGEKNRLTIMRILAGNQIVIIFLDGLFSILLTCMAVFLAVWRFQNGAIWIGDALQIIFLSVLLLEPLHQVSGFFYIGMGGKAAQRALSAYQQQLNTKIVENDRRLKKAESGETEVRNEIGDKAERDRTGENPAAFMSSEQAPSLKIKDLDFAYDSRLPVLQKVNLEIPAGDKVVLIGQSGGGKTTLLHLLQGRLEPDRGSIEVAGKPAYLCTRDKANPIALVSQKTWLFTGTILDNLRVAKADASETEIWESLEKAGVADFIRGLPRGLETLVGEDGNYLSGGQAQRLSLARAFLSGRKLLILDEPTSQLDFDTEAQFIETLASIGTDYTVLIVTHRYQLLRVADTAYQLASGELRQLDVQKLLTDYAGNVNGEGESHA